MLIFAANLEPTGTAPLFGNLNGGDTFQHGQACTITGLQLDTSGTLTLIQGPNSVVQTTDTWAADEITFTADADVFAYGLVVLEIAVAGGLTQVNVQLTPAAGKAYILADVPWDPADYSVFEGASPPIVDGDQLEYDLVTNNGGNVTMFADGTFTIDDSSVGHTFDIRAFDFSDSTWSLVSTVGVNANPLITVDVPIDTDGVLLLGQVGAVITGTNFGVTQGSVTIGGVAQTVQAWTDTQITFIVPVSTPLGNVALVVANDSNSKSAAVIVQSNAGLSPVFNGPIISIGALQQNTAMAPVSVAARFQDPVGQALSFSTVGTWPPGVTVTSVSGVIQGTPSVPGSYDSLMVRATDPDGNPVNSNLFSIVVNAAVASTPVFIGPVISFGSLAYNEAMTSVPVAALFQHPAGLGLTYSARGTWPPGVIVTASGTITGTPAAIGNYIALTVRATDPNGNFVNSNTFSIAIELATGGGGGGTLPPIGEPGTSVSDVAIANLALTKLGEARIVSFGDDTKAARAITAIYEMTRDAELRRRKWRFALKRASLPALASSPEFGYAYAYQLPADCLSILSVSDVAPGADLSDYRTGIDMGLYSLEGRQLLTDLGAPLGLRYKARITDPSQFDIAFVAAFASRLAYELAEDLTQSVQKREQAAADYKVALREAVAANAIEVAPEPMPDSSWLLSRQ